MKIDSSHSSTRLGTVDGKDGTTKPLRNLGTASSESPSTVSHLSPAGSKSEAQDVDAARVAEIRQAIREGRLEINADKIADGLIASVREQLGQD